LTSGRSDAATASAVRVPAADAATVLDALATSAAVVPSESAATSNSDERTR
jgi:hypothetical protein